MDSHRCEHCGREFTPRLEDEVICPECTIHLIRSGTYPLVFARPVPPVRDEAWRQRYQRLLCWRQLILWMPDWRYWDKYVYSSAN